MSPSVRVFVTGGTFDKEVNELTGTLAFEDTHLPEMLRLGRCLSVASAEASSMTETVPLPSSFAPLNMASPPSSGRVPR